MSGVAAVEMAQKLIEQGDEVALLILLDTERPRFYSLVLTEMVRLWDRGKHGLELVREFIKPADGTRRRQLVADVLQRKLRRARLTNAPITAVDYLYEHRTSYQRLLKKHRLKRYPGQIELLVTEDVYRFIPLLGWNGFADGGVEIHRTPGDHETVRAQNCKELGGRIRLSIDRAISLRRRQSGDAPRDQRPDSVDNVRLGESVGVAANE